jgi:phytoene dehydrogenase-like protein
LIVGKAVERIEVSGRKAVEAILEDGSRLEADYFVPACNVHHTLDKLLNGRYSIRQIDRLDALGERDQINTAVLAAFSVDAELRDFPHSIGIKARPFKFEDSTRDMVFLNSYADEGSFSPRGKSVLTAMLWAKYDWWKEKRKDEEGYRREKQSLGSALGGAIVAEFPELVGKLELLDVATPVTYERYCNAFRGGYMSYTVTPRSGSVMLNGRIGGIRNLFLAGQDAIIPGGLPIALVSGTYAIQRICRAERIDWRW